MREMFSVAHTKKPSDLLHHLLHHFYLKHVDICIDMNTYCRSVQFLPCNSHATSQILDAVS